MKEAVELKKVIDKYCKACVDGGFCEPDECEFCPVNQAYKMAESLVASEEDLNLPNEAVIEISKLDCCLNDEDKIMDAVVDFLTDEFGFCIRGCNISLEDEGLAKVTNIEWDTEE